MTFLRALWSLVTAHPLAFIAFLFAVVLFLGGIFWAAIRAGLNLLSKVPGGNAVASAIEKASTATGSN